jgi:alkylation response protein AidB-like acyl-CoA dehydrogenase
MDFGLSEEQELLQQSARDFLVRECPVSLVREVMRSADGFSPALHAKMAQMGWMGLIIPEKFGGLGLRMLDLGVLAEELGRAVVPGPFLSSSVLATVCLLHGVSAAHKRAWLPRLAAGQAIGTLALFEEEPRLDAAGIRTRCTATRTGYRLHGTKVFVTDALMADFLVVAARRRGHDAAGVCLLLVPRDAPGLSVLPLESVDQTHRVAEVVFDAVEVPKTALLADPPRGWKVVSRALDAASVYLAADSLGGAARALEMSVDYAKTRQQFGRPIGSFQAIKHMAAEMVSDIEPARALVWYAAYAYDHEPRRAAQAAAMAKARLGDVYSRVANRAVQMHGGIGFTWEHDMHLWFKRALWNRTAFGDPTFHRERVAQLAGF